MKNIEIKKLLLSVLAAGLWVACTESGLPVAGAEEGIMFKIADQEVEAACGQCKLGLEGSGCDLAAASSRRPEAALKRRRDSKSPSAYEPPRR